MCVWIIFSARSVLFLQVAAAVERNILTGRHPCHLHTAFLPTTRPFVIFPHIRHVLNRYSVRLWWHAINLAVPSFKCIMLLSLLRFNPWLPDVFNPITTGFIMCAVLAIRKKKLRNYWLDYLSVFHVDFFYLLNFFVKSHKSYLKAIYNSFLVIFCAKCLLR